jgi:hypothetical protein
VAYGLRDKEETLIKRDIERCDDKEKKRGTIRVRERENIERDCQLKR